MTDRDTTAYELLAAFMRGEVEAAAILPPGQTCECLKSSRMTDASAPFVAYQRSPSLPAVRFAPLRKVSVMYGSNSDDVNVLRIV